MIIADFEIKRTIIKNDGTEKQTIIGNASDSLQAHDIVRRHVDNIMIANRGYVKYIFVNTWVKVIHCAQGVIIFTIEQFD